MNPHLAASDIPRGFTFAATHCGVKRSPRLDLGILVSDVAATAAAVFTTNQIVAAPVIASREHLRKARDRMRGVVVNSGNANCCTEEDGYPASVAMASRLADALGIDRSQVLVSSTGVIGAPLPVGKILAAIPHLALARSAEPGAFEEFARAIMTTDTRPKWATARCPIGGKQVRLLACAKGSGMIQPDMATMLAFIATDAAVSSRVLDHALRAAVEPTFNSITVDGDTSTNDTVAILANGKSGAPEIAKTSSPEYRAFRKALQSVCKSLALAIVEDGEGAQRIIEIEVRGASSESAARQVARTIANSPLVKTAFAGADPNWGRILAAAGRSGVKFDPARASIWIAHVSVCHRGREHAFDERSVHQQMLAKFVPVRVDLGSGQASWRVWTCDFTIEYVHINSSYRT